MRLLYLDVDTLRPDHLGCYGYPRPTSPAIDQLAADGLRFDGVYVSDSPCLPSRSALSSGRFGISNGVVNHGGRRAEPFPSGPERRRQSAAATSSWPSLLRKAGLWCASISTFAQRHSAFHWHAGFHETVDLGTGGLETADAVETMAVDWLRRRGAQDGWFLHVHLWDPHTPYRAPAGFGRAVTEVAPPTWIDESVIAEHRQLPGPHSAQEVMGFGPNDWARQYPRQPQAIEGTDDVRAVLDGYDTAVRYADESIGRIVGELDALGVLEETVVVVSSDHGENLGELGIYCDHQTADEHTHHVPMIVRWPGGPRGAVDRELRYQFDVAASLAELAGSPVPPAWDGVGFELGRPAAGRSSLVLSCATWSVQRAVRFDRWLCIRTYHAAFHDFPPVMLFDVDCDPHERRNLAEARPDVVAEGARILLEWEAAALSRSPAPDPLWTVLAEGGGYYVRGRLEDYLDRLERTGRSDAAARLRAREGKDVRGPRPGTGSWRTPAGSLGGPTSSSRSSR